MNECIEDRQVGGEQRVFHYVDDSVTMETGRRRGNNVPAWFIDADYNDLCFPTCARAFRSTLACCNYTFDPTAVYQCQIFVTNETSA